MTDLERANRFWENARNRVLRLAETAGLNITISEHDDEFLFDLFDCGDYEPSDEEIITAIKEDLL